MLQLTIQVVFFLEPVPSKLNSSVYKMSVFPFKLLNSNNNNNFGHHDAMVLRLVFSELTEGGSTGGPMAFHQLGPIFKVTTL